MMLNQSRGGHIFNMDGAGADGRPTPRYFNIKTINLNVILKFYEK